MANGRVRTHVLVPRELVKEVNRLVGSRHRSEFFAEAVAEKLARVRLAAVARQAAGSLRDVPIPGWESSAAAAEWVQALRQADEARYTASLPPQEKP